MLDGGEDLNAVVDAPLLEFDDGRDPAASGPADPDPEGFGGLVDRELNTGRGPFLSR